MIDNQTMPETYVPEDFRMGSWILKTELSSGAKLTFSVLAVCAGGRDYVWPSQDYLAEAVSASVRTVQRYLKELADFGLIRIGKKRLMGQFRTIYSFLNHALVGFEPKAPAAAPKPARKMEKPALARTTKTAKAGDKNDVSHNKEESNLENNNTPPTPQTPELEPGQVPGPDGGCDEDPVWTQAKERLEADIPPGSFKTWLKPLRFERRDQKTMALLAPNPFFLNWVKQHYGDEIRQVFQSFGYEIRLEVDELTPKGEHTHQSVQVVAPKMPPQEVDWEALSLDDQFEKIYAAYPKKERFWDGLRAFKRLVKQGECSARQLIKAIFRQRNTDGWHREDGRFVPQFHNWLLGKRWMD